MPGLLDDIITDHAGTVMGGSHERSSPCTPFWQRHFKFGKSSSQRSKTNSGAAQSSPINMTRGRVSCRPVRKAASHADLRDGNIFNGLCAWVCDLAEEKPIARACARCSPGATHSR